MRKLHQNQKRNHEKMKDKLTRKWLAIGSRFKESCCDGNGFRLSEAYVMVINPIFEKIPNLDL